MTKGELKVRILLNKVLFQRWLWSLAIESDCLQKRVVAEKHGTY